MIRALPIGIVALVGVLALALASTRVATAGPVVLADDGPAKVALLLGVTDFEDDGWPDLRYTARDAEELGKQLRANAGFRTQVMVDPGETTRAAFVRMLDRAGSRLQPEDTLVVYLSTHGTLSRDLRGDLRQVLVFADTDHDRPLDTGLTMDELLERFEALPSRRKVLVLATCYSGAGKSSLSDAIRGFLAGAKGAVAPPLYAVSSATVVLSASAWGEAAREDERLEHDVYTHFLIEALHGYDPNHDGATSVTEAHDFARQQTYRFTGGTQRPTALMTIEGEDPIVLAGERRNEGAPVLLSYRTGFDGLEVVVNGTPKGALPGGVVLDPGWHTVVLRRPAALGGEEILNRRVYLRPGERLDLGVLYGREPPWQVEVRGLIMVRAGSDNGSDVVPLGGTGLLLRRQDVFLPGLDLSLAAEIGFGVDTLAINREQFAASLMEVSARLGVGTHVDLEPFVLHLDGWGGVGYHSVVVDSVYYSGPRDTWMGILGVSAALRWRFLKIWSVGAGVGVDYAVGSPRGFGGNGWLVVALSF